MRPPGVPLPFQLFTAVILAEGDAVAQLVVVFKVEHIVHLQLELGYKNICGVAQNIHLHVSLVACVLLPQ